MVMPACTRTRPLSRSRSSTRFIFSSETSVPSVSHQCGERMPGAGHPDPRIRPRGAFQRCCQLLQRRRPLEGGRLEALAAVPVAPRQIRTPRHPPHVLMHGDAGRRRRTHAAGHVASHLTDHERLQHACGELDPPFACVDLDAFDANRDDAERPRRRQAHPRGQQVVALPSAARARHRPRRRRVSRGPRADHLGGPVAGRPRRAGRRGRLPERRSARPESSGRPGVQRNTRRGDRSDGRLGRAARADPAGGRRLRAR